MICPELHQILIAKIQDAPQQQITFAEYMQLALYHPQYGYYSSGKVSIGSQGDFFTSSSLGRDFGELLALQLEGMWQNLGCPHNFWVVEMGAGNGELAGDILNYIRSQGNAEFTRALSYTIIEESTALITLQQQRLANSDFDLKFNLDWQNWSDISDNSIVGCFLSNELVDAFPVHLVTKNSDRLQEVYLSLEQDKLIESIQPLSTNEIEYYLSLVEIDLSKAEYAGGYRTEINLDALNWLKTVANKLQRGYVLTIDYGYSADKYYRPSRDRGTLQCHAQHRRHNNPYANLGCQDITAHIDFTALQRQGELCNLETIGFTQQGTVFNGFGFRRSPQRTFYWQIRRDANIQTSRCLTSVNRSHWLGWFWSPDSREKFDCRRKIPAGFDDTTDVLKAVAIAKLKNSCPKNCDRNIKRRSQW